MVSLSLPARVELANLPTPFEPVKLPGLTDAHPNIWLKRDDLTGSALTGNKVRKLEFVVQKALDDGCDTLITCGGLQSNHCRATALVGAKLGLHVHLVLREEGAAELDGNLFLSALSGATVERLALADYRKRLNSVLAERADDYKKLGKKAHIIPTGASDGFGLWGYVACAEELKADFIAEGISPDVIATATGSGGTQAGLTLGALWQELQAQVVGYAVCDSEDYFNQKVITDIRHCAQQYDITPDYSLLQPKTVVDYIGPGYAKAYPELLNFVRETAASTGILLDPVYTGKGLYGLVTDVRKGVYDGCKDIVFVHTGGVYGLFPFRQDFGL